MTYNKALNEFNKFLGTNFVSTKLKDDIGTWDLSATEEDLYKLGLYVQSYYDWFANGESRRPGRAVDIIGPNFISKLGSMRKFGDDVKITIYKSKIIIEKAEKLQWADNKYKTQQRVSKNKFALNFKNERITEPVISQPCNLPFEYVEHPEELKLINGKYWKLVKEYRGKKYYRAPITNSFYPFLIV